MGYYSDKLSAELLMRCYRLAPPRVCRYLEAEILHLLSRVDRSDTVLELGCGYGRVALELAGAVRRIVGIDTAAASIEMARRRASDLPNCEFHEMDAVNLRFPDGGFDTVICIQNGICAFGVDRDRLVREALRVTRPGGSAIFSSYAEDFWPHRLEWFELQAADGLLGSIDREATGDGVIVCRDGFRAGAMNGAAFEELCAGIGVVPAITIVDGSSVFCEIVKPAASGDHDLS